MVKRDGRLVIEVDGLHCGEFLTIVAAEFQVLFVHYIELGGHSLGVGDAFGVGAFDKILDVVGYFGGEFFYHLIVFNGDDGYKWGNEGHFAHLFFGEVFILNLDDTFAAEFVALEVVANEYFVFVFFKSENMDYLINSLGGDMVDDCAIFDGRDDEFFF